MCGIFAGLHTTTEYVAERIKDLQYRGGDEYGLSTFTEHGPLVYKKLGREIDFVDIRKKFDHYGQILGHCRWASSSKVSIANCHPIISSTQKLALIHNGSIENYKEIEEYLKLKYDVHSLGETDTEVATNWIAQNPWNLDVPEEFDRMSIKFQEAFLGTWAIAFAVQNLPHKLFFLVKDSPLYYHEGFLSSDGDTLPAFYKIPNNSSGFVQFWPNTDQYFLYLNGTYVEVKYSQAEKFVKKSSSNDITQIQDFPLKDKMFSEIEEQSLLNYDFDKWGKEFLNYWNTGTRQKTIKLIGCGSSFHACKLAQTYFENACIPCSVDYASEYNYFNATDRDELKILVSQSGETADIKDVLQNLKGKCDTLLLTNKQMSSCADYASRTVNLVVGPEKAVGATKSFSASALALLAFANYAMGDFDNTIVEEFKKLTLEILQDSRHIEATASEIAKFHNSFILGNGQNYAIANEIALKLKEISLMHAEVQAFGEQKHGGLALQESSVLNIAILGGSENTEKYPRLLGNLDQIKAREGCILGIGVKKEEVMDWFIKVPYTNNKFLAPLLNNVVGQLLSYYIGKHKGLLVDTPRSLAKSITVY